MLQREANRNVSKEMFFPLEKKKMLVLSRLKGQTLLETAITESWEMDGFLSDLPNSTIHLYIHLFLLFMHAGGGKASLHKKGEHCETVETLSQSETVPDFCRLKSKEKEKEKENNITEKSCNQ